MKVGMITFHRATNCGAALQTFGLFSYLKELGVDVEIIDFIPNNIAYTKKSKLRKFFHYIKCILTPIKTIHHNKREKQFNEFIQNNFIMSKDSFFGDKDIDKFSTNYDCIISGSDQILNTTLTGNSKAYYLNFSNLRKISYASSFGRTNISQKEIDYIKLYLNNFDAISVREKSSISIIQEYIKKPVEFVCDPVFLMNMNFWLQLTNFLEKKDNKYIFVYLMEDNEITSSVLEAVKKKYELTIVTVIGGKVSKKYPNIDYECGPRKFLQYIYNAEFVITNSFHATAFSLIFKKNFCTISHSCRNARLESLFNVLELENKLIDKVISLEEINQFVIDGDKEFSKMNNLIYNSKQYIKNNLKRKKER